MESFPFLDLLFVVVIFLLFLRGFLKGTLKELFSLGIMSLAFFLATSSQVYFPFLRSLFSSYGFGMTALPWTLFIILWAVQTLILFAIFKFINLNAKGCFSRFLGGIVCTVKGHILFFIIFPSLSNNNTSYIKFFEKSNTILFPFFKKIKNQIYELFSLIGI